MSSSTLSSARPQSWAERLAAKHADLDQALVWYRATAIRVPYDPSLSAILGLVGQLRDALGAYRAPPPAAHMLGADEMPRCDAAATQQ